MAFVVLPVLFCLLVLLFVLVPWRDLYEAYRGWRLHGDRRVEAIRKAVRLS